MIYNGLSLSGSYSQDETITIQKWIDTVNAKYKQHAMDNVDKGESDYNQPAEETAKNKAAEKAAKEKKNGGL